MPLIVLVAGVCLVGLFGLVALYDTLVRRRNAIDHARGAVAAHLKERFDLVPALIETTKSEMTHERELFQQLASLRERALAPSVSVDELSALDTASRQAITTLVARAEAYPVLGSSQAFVEVQRGLRHVEEQLAAARRAYNTSVVDLNNSIDVLPNRLFAGMLGFTRQTVFQVSEREAQPVDVGALFASRP